MWQKDQAVPNREKRTIRIEFVNLARQTQQTRLEHRRVVPKQPFAFLSGLWIGTLSPTTGHQLPPCTRGVDQHKHN